MSTESMHDTIVHQERMRQEVAYLQGRLRQIGDRGDCAYEHSLARAYLTLLQERQALLEESARGAARHIVV